MRVTLLRRPDQHVGIGLVLLVVVAGLAVALAGHTRPGAAILAGGMWLAAGLRLVLSPRRVGLLAVRSRRLDVLVTVALAVALTVLAVVVPVGDRP